MLKEYDVIVVGAGHAGCEAANIAGKMGSKVLLVTMNMNTIAQMSCNPAVGGVAKGQIVREIDALGGGMGFVADKSAIQRRMLNRSKGPAMWSPRTQNDRNLFANEWRLLLERNVNVDFWQDVCSEVLVEDGRAVGIQTQLGLNVFGKSVVLTNGTFLNGKIHVGEKQFGGGRAAERGVAGLTGCLEGLGFTSGRMKTGTPPRVDGRSLNYDIMEEQSGDQERVKFSFWGDYSSEKQRSCHITYTNPLTHDLLRTGFDRSPMFNGAIESTGPRYCPSIEDKIVRFKERERHQIFVEPEGWDTVEVYVNGFSTSLPEEVQMEAIRSIVGFEKAKLFRPGYAIEYDFFHPTQLRKTLETKHVDGLYFAGQINGTTGYEEAGGQGLMAGVNAHLKINEKEPFVLGRDEAYIGVLIDDLVTKGTDEPYRMFTSRAEFRILLRQDNADLRLSDKAHSLGMIDDEQYKLLDKKKESIKGFKNFVEKKSVSPNDINERLKSLNSAPISQKVKLSSVISRPNIDFKGVCDVVPGFKEECEGLGVLADDVLEQVEVDIKYKGYIDRERESAEKIKRLEGVVIPDKINYSDLKSLSAEAKEKLSSLKPETVGQASRVSGVSPSDISVLLVFLGR